MEGSKDTMLTKVVDVDDALPFDASKNQHSQGDLCFQGCLLHRKLPQFMYLASAAALDPR